MKESLAARQAALLRQNAELDQKVEAIEQRRQQQLHRTASGKVAAVAPPVEAVLSDGDNGGGYDDESDAASSPDRAQLRKHLGMDLSESMDSITAEKAADQPEEAVKSEAKPAAKPSPTRRRSQLQRKKSTGPETATASARKLQQQVKRPKSAHVETDNNVDVGQSLEAKHEEPPSPDAKQSGGGGRGGDDDDGDGLGLEATVRYQKARLRVLQDELETTQGELKEMQTAQQQLKAKIDELASDNGSLKKKHQQTLQLLEKQQELSAAQESKQKILETQLSAAQTKMEEIQKAEKQASQQFRSKDVRLNRALEELEKAKAQLQEERRTHGEQMIAKGEYEQVVKDNKRLEKQKNELLLAFKKQMKLIDLLKRQRIHMEAAKMLSFTEEEFSKTLELG